MLRNSWHPEAGLNDELVRWIGLGIQNVARFQKYAGEHAGYPLTHPCIGCRVSGLGLQGEDLGNPDASPEIAAGEPETMKPKPEIS